MSPALSPLLAAGAIALAACAAPPGAPAPAAPPFPAAALAGGEWNVERIEDRPLLERSFIAMSFGADGRVLGRAACNGWSAAYKVDGKKITFAGGAATLRACPGGLTEQEGSFHRMLSKVTRYEFAPDGALLLLADDGRSIRARRG